MGGHNMYETKLRALIEVEYRTKLRINKVKRSFHISDTPKERRTKAKNLSQLNIILSQAQNELDKLQRDDDLEKTENQLTHRESAPTTPNIPTL